MLAASVGAPDVVAIGDDPKSSGVQRTLRSFGNGFDVSFSSTIRVTRRVRLVLSTSGGLSDPSSGPSGVASDNFDGGISSTGSTVVPEIEEMDFALG